MAKLTDAFIDTIFKIIFGKENFSEEFLIDFLNEIFLGSPGFDEIVEVRYNPGERIEETAKNKRIIYDIHCRTSNGQRFIVEMQRANQRNFTKRMFYYLARLITDQVKKIKQENKESHDADKRSEYDYEPVVGVFLCNFVIDGMPKKPLVRCVFGDEETGEAVSHVVRMAFIQFPLFEKKEEEIKRGSDMWMYILKNMKNLDTLPFKEYKNQLFERLERVTSYAALSPKEQAQYDEDLKFARDYQETMLYQYDQGEARGLAQGIKLQSIKIARNLLSANMPPEFISKTTGLTLEEVLKLSTESD